MQKNTSVTLGNHFEIFVADQVLSGRYGSASETIRAGLRLLEENESRLKILQNALIEGENSGIGTYSLESLIDELHGVTD